MRSRSGGEPAGHAAARFQKPEVRRGAGANRNDAPAIGRNLVEDPRARLAERAGILAPSVEPLEFSQRDGRPVQQDVAAAAGDGYGIGQRMRFPEELELSASKRWAISVRSRIHST